MVEVLDGKAVAQGVGTYLFGQPGAHTDCAHDVLHAAYRDAVGVRFPGGAREEVIRRFFGTEVCNEVAAHGIFQGKRTLFSALGIAYNEGSVAAVEVVQADACDLSGA